MGEGHPGPSGKPGPAYRFRLVFQFHRDDDILLDDVRQAEGQSLAVAVLANPVRRPRRVDVHPRVLLVSRVHRSVPPAQPRSPTPGGWTRIPTASARPSPGCRPPDRPEPDP
jgi:hypothetical protein